MPVSSNVRHQQKQHALPQTRAALGTLDSTVVKQPQRQTHRTRSVLQLVSLSTTRKGTTLEGLSVMITRKIGRNAGTDQFIPVA